MKNNVVAEIFLFFGILFMFMIWALPKGYYFLVPATFSVICFTFALTLYKPEIKQKSMKELFDLLEQAVEEGRDTTEIVEEIHARRKAS